MSIGGKSFQRDMRFLQAQLEALQFVLNERGAGVPGYDSVGVTDFSGPPKTFHPPGTGENLNY